MDLSAQLPCRFGKYLLLERIGRGGMADVFRAKLFGAAGFEKECAIKVILPTLIEDPQFVGMFIDEAKVAVWLNHANIVQIYDLGQADGQYYITMEYVAGKDLLDLLAARARARQRIPPEVAIHIAVEMLRGLEFAHHAVSPIGEPLGIVHRDVSPSNVLLSYQGHVKMADFGIAKSQVQSSRTEAGTHKGKMGYMSPEQVIGAGVDPRSDVFSAGVILFEMLTMSRLFKAANDLDVMIKIRDVDIAQEMTRTRDLPHELRAILQRALTKRVDDRYPSAEAFAEALLEFGYRHEYKANAAQLSSLLREAFAEKIALEMQRRRLDPVAGEEMTQPLEPRPEGFRYRGADGAVAGPMSDEELRRLLGATQGAEGEAVSVAGGPWVAPSELPGFTSVTRALEQPGHEATTDVRARDASMALNLEGPINKDWEDLALAGINPNRARRMRDDELDGDEGRPLPEPVRLTAPNAAAVGAGPDETTSADGDEGDLQNADIWGDFSSISIARLLQHAVECRANGILVIRRHGESVDLVLNEGRLMAVDRDHPDEVFGGYLIHRGVLTPEQLDYALVRATRYAGRLGATLVSEGILTPHELYSLLGDCLRDQLLELFGVSDGDWFWFDRWSPDGAMVPAAIDLDQLMQTGTRERCTMPYLRAFFKPHRHRGLRPTSPELNFMHVRLPARALRMAMSIEAGATVQATLQRFSDHPGWRELDAYQMLFVLTERGLFAIVGDEAAELALPGSDLSDGPRPAGATS